jgi:peptide/nickel transport system ATP-binding protein
VHSDKVPGDLCITELPELLPASSGTAHLKRCHLADPVAVYESEVLPEIAPDLVEETR